MKTILQYFALGLLVALGGLFVTAYAGHFFNGLGGYGFGCLLGLGLYLCVVVVTCTGMIVTKLQDSPSPQEKLNHKQ